VWPEFEPFIRSASGLSAGELRANPEIGRLREAVLRQIRDTGVVKVKIYNLQGRTVFSTEGDQIGADQSQNAGFVAARDGEVASELTHRATFSAFDKTIEDRDLFSSYVPLRSAEGSAPAAVFEIYTDVTPFLQQIARTQLRVVGGVALMLSALYATLFLIVRRADKLLLGLARRRERAEADVRRQALTFDNIHDSVVFTELKGSIVDCNSATERIFGYPRSEVIGNNLGLWYRPTDRAALRAQMIEAISHERRWAGEIPFVRKDGRRGICEVVIVPLRDERGRRLGRIWVGHDITERAHAEEVLVKARDAAEAASRAKSQFLANISHELRTPLTAIIGYGDLLQRDAERAGQARFVPGLANIQAAGQHLLALINDLLDMSKIEAGNVELHLEVFPIAQIVEEVVALVQPLAQTNQNTLEVLCSPDLGAMSADPTKVRQVLFNLLSNAAKFTERGEIALTAAREANGSVDWVRFGVADTGIGMEREQLDRLFQSFAQGDSTTTRKYGGAGLGLALSRHFCEMMGGHITVASAPRVGSTFIVYLPAAVGDSFVQAGK
jgi:PAS domain S-box-containing protein